MQEYSHLRKLCWGRHLWARGFFVASSGNVTDEVIMESIRTQAESKADRDVKAADKAADKAAKTAAPAKPDSGH